MVSMKDIAVACGVSVATVSKALNDHHDISDETKEKVREKCAELGYFPNAAAKALKTNRSHNLGVLFADEALSGLTHDFFANVLDSFKRTAEKKGYDITFINCSNKKYLEHVLYRGFDGVIIACINFLSDEVGELVGGKVPVVTIDHEYDNRTAVVSDNSEGVEELVKYISSMGHKKVAFIHGELSRVTDKRIKAFRETAKEVGIEVREDFIMEADYRNSQKTYERTLELLNLKDRPTCIMYPDDFSVFGGIKAIREKKLSFPEDVSIVGYDGLRIGRELFPPLTTYMQDTESIGREAALCLIDTIEHPGKEIKKKVLIKGELYKGGTVRKLN